MRTVQNSPDLGRQSTPTNPNELVEHLSGDSQPLVSERTLDLLKLFPEAATEGSRIDFDRLRLALGDAIDTGRERYGMTWPGKSECFRVIQAPSIATLQPVDSESVRPEVSGNVIIEADNLEALKLLQKSYTGKVKAIYIDPPYNTGHDFVYQDNFDQPLRSYLELTGQVDAERKALYTNADSSGRFHSNWLNMMYPRLYMARNLLREDGVIFVSIDDTELKDLQCICDEVFGEENRVGVLIHQRAKGGGQAKQLVRGHDYILVYARSLTSMTPLRRDKVVQSKRETIDGVEYIIDDDVVRKQFGRYDRSLGDRRCFYEELIEYKSEAKKAEIDAALARGELFLQQRQNGLHVICRRTPVDNLSSKLYSIIKVLSEEGKGDLEALGLDDVFDYPKPVDLVSQLVDAATGPDDLVLDFFAGSGTTAQAVLELNAKDGGHRKFILVQLPEATGREDYPTIADITKERVRRVIQKLGTDDGFRVFKLAESNFTAWDSSAVQDADGLARQLQLHVDHIRPDRTDSDLLFEVLLKAGYPLTAPTESLTVGGATAYRVDEGKLLVCLERRLTIDAIRAMADLKPERVVCLDAGFADNDQLKTNAVQIFKTKGVPSFKTI